MLPEEPEGRTRVPSVKATSRERAIWAALVATVAGVFLVTILTPLGYSPWLLYMVPLFGTRWLPGRNAPLLVAGVITVLMLAGLRLAPAGVEPVYALVSRLLAAAVFWAIAAFLVAHERVERERIALTKKERTARAEAEARHGALAELLDRMNDGFVALDRDWRYTYVNRRAGEMVAREPASMIGKDMWAEFPGLVGQPLQRAYEQALAEQRPVELETYYEPWGRWFENRAYPSSDGLAIFFTDITERKHAEERLREANRELEARVRERTAQLADSNKDLEAFSYSVSHDLRAPLRAVSGFAEIVARRHRAALDEEGRRYVDNIVEASRRMDRLIEDLLGYARLGRQGFASSRVPLGSLLEGVVRDLEPTVRALGAHVQVVEPAPVVRGNPTLLRQIFTNLLENALTYRKPGAAPRITVSSRVEGAKVVVRVSDDGIGIAPEHHEKIFEVFQRLHSQEEHAGSGIGLATVRRAVDLLGGAVWVESAAGEGCTFCVQLTRWEDATEDIS